MKWRVVKVETHDAFMNMALDEACCEAIAEGKSPPTIRFYRWNPSAVSIGYFQSLQDEVDTEKCRILSIDVVRRRTGGGAVYHDYDGEITYSIMAPQDTFPKGITESYQEICGYIVKALSKLGISASFHPINDVIADGKKISGSAQTRRNGILLQHGTILYDVDVDKMFSLLKVGETKISDKFIQSVKKRVTRVLDFNECSLLDLSEAMIKGFTEGKEFEFGEWTQEERTRAKELSATRYSKDEWNNLR